MTTSSEQHAGELLGPYALGVLEAGEVEQVRHHLAGCAECRAELAELEAMADMLGEVPPEAFLDGPPDGGELLLHRSLRAVRRQQTRTDRRRVLAVAAGIVALVVLALGGGVLVGRGTAPEVSAQPGSSPAASMPASPPASAPAGSRTISATDPATGASLTVTIVPAAGWIRMHAVINGVHAGEKCQLVVRPRGGGPAVGAGSWVVGQKAEQTGVTLDSVALVAPDNVGAVQIVTLDGRTLVSAPG
jgi:Putative zinc-finger